MKYSVWLDVPTADIPTFDSASTLEAQATAAFGAACGTNWDGSAKTTFTCAKNAAFPKQLLTDDMVTVLFGY